MSTFGITLVSGTAIESVDLEKKVEEKIIMDTDGSFLEGKVFDPSFSFTVKGKGTVPVSIGGSSGEPDGASGKVIVTSIEETQFNTDFAGFSYSGVSYPSAS